MRLVPKGKSASEPSLTITVGSIVEYEQHSQPMLGVVTADKRGKWGVLNSKGAQLDLPGTRLYLLPGSVPENLSTAEKANFLTELEAQAAAGVAAMSLDELWSLLIGEREEIGVEDIIDLAFTEKNLLNHLVARRALLSDQIYFKRGKTNFEPRPAEVVEELKVKARVEGEKKRARDLLLDALVARVRGQQADLPDSVEEIEKFAALGKSAERSKESSALVDEAVERAGLDIKEHGQVRAFRLLVAAGHFQQDQNLSLLRMNRKIRFDRAALRETDDICNGTMSTDIVPKRRDLRELLTFTIDNADTKDLDDAISIERMPEGGFRIGIHITDVASFIGRGSALEKEAFTRATSIYTPDDHIPMLPPALSEGALSLFAGKDRRATSFFIEVDEHFEILRRAIEPSLIRVAHRFNYESADSVLCDEAGGSGGPELREALHSLWHAACAFEARRMNAGAMQFTRREMLTRVLPEGRVAIEEISEDTPAHKLVGELMILANETAALFARDFSLPMIFRSQEAPEVRLEDVGHEIPEGPAREYFRRSFLKRSTVHTHPAPHSGVGVAAYLQITSPIRRSTDLINQRQLTHFLTHQQPLYNADELSAILGSLEAGLDEAALAQRERSRYWLFKYLLQENIRELSAIIVKVDGPKPLIELDVIFMLAPFHPLGDKSPEAMKKRRGERIRVHLENIDPRRDYLVLREIQANAQLA